MIISPSAAGNFVAGLVMTFMRPFLVGDRIRVDDVEGRVIDFTMIVTRVLTPKNEYVSIPNLRVLDKNIVNFTRFGKVRGVGVSVEVTIGYDVSHKTVNRLLMQAAANTTDIEESPTPIILQKTLGDFSICYELIAFTKNVLRMPIVRSELTRQVIEEFAVARVEILSPIYQCNRDGSPAALPEIPGAPIEPEAA